MGAECWLYHQVGWAGLGFYSTVALWLRAAGDGEHVRTRGEHVEGEHVDMHSMSPIGKRITSPKRAKRGHAKRG